MNEFLHQKYENISLPTDIVDMFVEVLKQDDLNYAVLRPILEKHKLGQPCTIAQLIENIKVDRRVGKRNKETNSLMFAIEKTNIDRKAAEKIVDRLSYMGLIYSTPELPYKRLYLTRRGIQIIKAYMESKITITNNETRD